MVEIFGIEITQQALLVGTVTGLTYAVFAAGFVLIYRSTGVLNFAQGELGVFGVALMALLTTQYSIPYWFALVLSVLACALIGAVIELTVVRRLFNAPRLILLIATLGVGQLLLFCTMSLPEVRASGPFPLPFNVTWTVTDDLTILARELQVLIVVPVLIIGLALFMTRTKFGLAVRASASNADTARVYGISVKRTSTIVWTIAGAFAAITSILIAPLNGVTAAQAGTSALAAPLLLRALMVALIARMRSLPMVLVGGVIVGVVETIVRRNVASTDRAIVDVYLFLAILVLVLFNARGGREEDAGWSLSPRVKPIPERLRSLWYVRYMPHLGFAVIFGFLALLPAFIDRPSQLFLWTSIVLYAVVTLSITMLTGWAGQLSLGQFAFVGLGGLTTVALRNGHDIPVPFDLWDMSFELPWGVAVALGTLTGVLAAFVIGLPALRVQGLFLAVTTLAFAVATASWVFRQDVFLDGRSTTPSLSKPSFAGVDFASRKSYYLLCLGVLVVAALVVARLRRTGIGRSFIAVRDNAGMAAASTVSPRRMKLSAFALAGGMAALAGGLFVTLLNAVTPEVIFNPGESVRLVAIAIIGGLGSVAGPIIGALYVLGLPTVLGDTDEIRLLTSSIGLLILLMYFPGGLMQIAYSVRDAILGVIERRLDERGVEQPVPAIAKRVPTRHHVVEVPAPGEPWLAVRNLTVRFGGNRAVHNVDIDVYEGEIVGLIGANGAGKSTLMNAISGFVPSTGTVHALGRDLSGMPAFRRHQRGLGRGFQSARLYPDLTVRETLMVALEARERSLLLPSLTGLPPSPAAERRKRSEAGELVDFLGLGRYADQFIAYLSTGTRRIVELGSLLAVDARVLLLDEPTGGVAQRETEAFGPLIVRVQRELEAAVLVIEHDMPLVMSISDRIYCLEAGELIAEGTPTEVRNDPLVIASYLGTDERAIQRSGAAGLAASSGG